MARYLLQHLTKYTYDEPVSVCHHLAHLLPRNTPQQAWRSAELAITPEPAVRNERFDYFGNRVTFFAIQEPHRELSVRSQGSIDLHTTHAPAAWAGKVTWEHARDRWAAPASGGPALIDALQFTLPSPYVQWNEEIAAYARPSFGPDRPLLDAALELVARLHGEFKYDPKSTTISTTLPEVMKARAGVCQDFAHLLIGGLRSLGLAARYVSGYLLTTPPPGKARLVGADASHAWVSLYVPGEGVEGVWVDLDPTNNLIPSDKHITAAWGRDFGDVSPIRGIILGGGRHQLQVSVDVSPV